MLYVNGMEPCKESGWNESVVLRKYLVRETRTYIASLSRFVSTLRQYNGGQEATSKFLSLSHNMFRNDLVKGSCMTCQEFEHGQGISS